MHTLIASVALALQERMGTQYAAKYLQTMGAPVEFAITILARKK